MIRERVSKSGLKVNVVDKIIEKRTLTDPIGSLIYKRRVYDDKCRLKTFSKRFAYRVRINRTFDTNRF